MLSTTTANVHITVLPSQQLQGTLQSLYDKLLYSWMQTSADSLSGLHQVICMTDGKGETWSPSKMSVSEEPAWVSAWMCYTLSMAACLWGWKLVSKSLRATWQCNAHDLLSMVLIHYQHEMDRQTCCL